MKATTAVRRLAEHDRKGRHVFAGEDLAKIFHEDSPRALAACLQRLVEREILLRVARGVYVYNLSGIGAAAIRSSKSPLPCAGGTTTT